MDESQKQLPQSSKRKNFLPDVVHSQQIPAGTDAAAAAALSGTLDDVAIASQDVELGRTTVTVDSEVSEAESVVESISEHISKINDSLSETDNPTKCHESHNVLIDDGNNEKTVHGHSSINICQAHSPYSDNPSDNDPSRQSASWPDVNVASDVHISEESPVNLALSSEMSKDTEEDQDAAQSHRSTELETAPPRCEKYLDLSSTSSNISEHEQNKKSIEPNTLKESPRSGKYLDSLNEGLSLQSKISDEQQSLEKSNETSEKVSIGNDESIHNASLSINFSGSEEIIKLDIRGTGVPKIPLETANIIFGPPPEGSTIVGGNIESIPVFQNLLSPFLIGAGESINIEEVYDNDTASLSKDPSLERSPELETKPSISKSAVISPELSLSDHKVEQDVLLEEVTVDQDIRTKEEIHTQPKLTAFEETLSMNTLTDYKSICEDYHVKLVHLEGAISQRDQLIDELTISLQHSVQERDELQTVNIHLTTEVSNLQHKVAAQTEHDTIKAQLSDFIKYETMVKDDSAQLCMSRGSSVHSSNGEKDMDREEITVNYSRSDLKSSDSEDFTGFEDKVATIINKFDEGIEENLRNKLRESIIQVLCDEIGRMRLEYDTELKELETQLQHDRQTFSTELRRLRELLASVKAGNADIETLRQELGVKHEKEMENLRTYFEKKCSDMERSYSEEVWRGRTCQSPGATSSLGGSLDEAGDAPRRRTRSAEFTKLTEPLQPEQSLKQTTKKHDQLMEEMVARHKEIVTALEEQIVHLKAHIQTAENTEANVSCYHQDIDLELEKEIATRVDAVRAEVAAQLQEQIQVLLSDPDAEVSSWPVELVALRDKIYGDTTKQTEKETATRGEEGVCEPDKWRQKRNQSFDQNRHLEEVTKERDGFKLVAVTLQRVVSQLVSYCACAEDELNRTVLHQLLAAQDQSLELGSRPASPDESRTSLSRSKHVHFAPDLRDILHELDESGSLSFLQEQRDVSGAIKRELELSLARLRAEAQDLLLLSATMASKRVDNKALESSVCVTDLVRERDRDGDRDRCDGCQLHHKEMEEAMAECLQREKLVRSELDAALLRIAQLAGGGDLVAEGYGLALLPPFSPQRPPARGRPPPESGALSLDGCLSPRASRLDRDMDLLLQERDDLLQQLEAANRQLRSTRQFVEEQAAERETERDEFARRLSELRAENVRLSTRLQNNARILSEVEQLEAQARDMNQLIADLESRKAATDEELKSSEEKVILLRDIIGNLETQLEQKCTHEKEIVEQLELMKRTIDERDSKMRAVLGELESLRSERDEQSDVMCCKCGQEEDRYNELVDKVKEQCQWLEEKIYRQTRRLERAHEVCSAACSEPSEDVSLRDHHDCDWESPPSSPRAEQLGLVWGSWVSVGQLSRAQTAALKRLQDLEMTRDQLLAVTQEVRAERDVLQTRMSEQALKISSLSARLQQQRNDADALAQQAHSQLTVRLHDARAEVQRLHEELESKDKQLARLKQTLEERDNSGLDHSAIYRNTCNPSDKVVILERELSSAQRLIVQLEDMTRELREDREQLRAALREGRGEMGEREDREQQVELMALKLDEENQKEDRSEVVEGKTSARTLSDIVSISEFDEQDLQMRRAVFKTQNISFTGAPFDTNKTINRTLPPEVQQPNLSSLNIDYGDHFDYTTCSPRADSLPAHLTSTQYKDPLKQYKRNLNETTVGVDKFGDSVKHATSQNIPDNCSNYPNRDVNESKNLTVEPKKINFSLEPSQDNRTHDEFTSLREMGINLDFKQDQFPDILTQLKHEIKKTRNELQNCKSELKNAEEQLCEFPALKEEVEELKGLLENTMATMENDKKFYENQLDNFSSNKKLLEQRLTELTQEVNDKSQDLHLLKEDILRRENMILELAKEKRNLTHKMTELEVKIDKLQSRNNQLEKYESESHHMREKLTELNKMEHLVSEKNQQIDSLNQHLDRLDHLQRNLDDKTELLDNLKEAFEEKSNELLQMQDAVEALTRDVTKVTDENEQLNTQNKELKLKLSKVEKEQENASLKLQNSEGELERVNSLNDELTSRIEELKILTDKIKDQEAEIEILHEDINCYHEEIASLKEQLKMVSRSPSPKTKGEEKRPDRQASNDKKQLVRIRKQISLLQHELDFNKKELNDKAFELAKAKLDITELRGNLSQVTKQASERGQDLGEVRGQLEEVRGQLEEARGQLAEARGQIEVLNERLREESNVEEVRSKLSQQVERCRDLEDEVKELTRVVDRLRACTPPEAGERALVVRSPTLELERAVRDQLDYSHTLDEDIMEQILSASSDEREDIPRLALNLSKSSSPGQSPSAALALRLRTDNDNLAMQLHNLQDRLGDKDALIAELTRVRDQLIQELQTSKLLLEAERDVTGRLQLLLDTHKETAETAQNQDASMIVLLKKRLESAMSAMSAERGLRDGGARGGEDENETIRRLESEVSVLKAKLSSSALRLSEERAEHERALHAARAQLRDKGAQCTLLREDLAEHKRLKHSARVELIRAKELLSAQGAAIAQLADRPRGAGRGAQAHIDDALTEIESHKSELMREMSTLKKCLDSSPELSSLRAERQALRDRVQELETRGQVLETKDSGTPAQAHDEKDQAIRFLHGRCLRLESCRKALAWQKRYLSRVVAGYAELERTLGLPRHRERVTGVRRFRSVASVVVATLRMSFLVRRRQQLRAQSAGVLLGGRGTTPLLGGRGTTAHIHLCTPTSQYKLTSSSPPCRDIDTPRPDNLARRVMKQELRLNLPPSPAVGELSAGRQPAARGAGGAAGGTQGQPFLLRSPRVETATAYLNKLELVSRCLSHAMDAAGDKP